MHRADVIRFLVRWLVIGVVASVVAFGIARLMPTTPMEQMLASRQMPATEENVAALEHEWGLDRPLPEQYLAWVANFVRGDWGTSLASRVDIRSEFARKIPYTLGVGAGGLVIGSVAAFFLGYRAACRPHGVSDRLSRLLAVLGQTIPSFILAMLVIQVLGVRLRVVKFFTNGSAAGVVTAALIVALYLVGNLARVVKVHFLEQRRRPYVRFAVARGYDEPSYLLRHATRPVLCGLAGVLAARVPQAIGGSSVMEFAFGIPGISYFLISSLQAKDYYALQSYIMVVVLVMFVSQVVLEVGVGLLGGREEGA